MRGIITAPSWRLAAPNTSLSTRRSSVPSSPCVLTMSRSSSSVTSSPPARGSRPSIRTTAFVDTDSSPTTGRVSVATRSSVGATKSATRSLRCRARRLGTSSPSTSDR